MSTATMNTQTARHAAPQISRASAYWTLYTLTLRQHLHGRRWIAIALLFLLPASLALIIRFTAPRVPPEALEFILVMLFVPQAVLPIVALLYASGIIQDEQEEQTITYLLMRPIAKWAIYTLKLLATVTTTAVLVVVFTGLTYAAIYLGSEMPIGEVAVRWLKASAIHTLAVTTYCSLFGLMSLVTRWILVCGILYTAVVEGLLANFPFSIRLVTVIYYSRLIAYRTMTLQVPRPNGSSDDLAAQSWFLDPVGDPGLTLHPSVGTCIAVLLSASVVFTATAAWLCSQREFHVKTPEKD
jgi:ABC-2 type transport system permease protein